MSVLKAFITIIIKFQVTGGKFEKATKFDKISTLVFMLLKNAFSEYTNFITAQNPD